MLITPSSTHAMRLSRSISSTKVTTSRVLSGDFDDLSLLDDIGIFISAVRLHKVARTDAGPNEEPPVATKVAIQLGASLGVAQRFLTGHDLAINGRYRIFTPGESERLFTFDCLDPSKMQSVVVGETPPTSTPIHDRGVNPVSMEHR